MIKKNIASMIVMILIIMEWEIMNLFDEVCEENYYKPIFVISSHIGNCKHYESNGDIEKKVIGKGISL